MGYFYGCFAALFWGLKPPSLAKINANSITAQLGNGIGVLLFAIIIFFATYNQSIADFTSSVGAKLLLLSFLSGISWGVGQFFQIICFQLVTTSIGFCLTTATTLLANAIFSIVLFNDWSTPFQFGLGIPALFIIIIGAILTSYKQNNSTKLEDIKNDKKKLIIGIILAIIVGILFAIYSALPRYVTNQIAGTSVVLPHGIGTFVGSILAVGIVYLIQNFKAKKNSNYQKDSLFTKKLIQSIIPGLFSSIGNILLIYANASIGSAIGFSLTQMAVVVSSLVNLFILKEYKNKTKKQSSLIILGSIIILIGGVMIGFTKM